jgi:hypothetical protein
MTPKIAKHLSHAKRDIAQGTASFRSAAHHIDVAIKAGATQTEAAVKVGKSQTWVNRLLKWREASRKAARSPTITRERLLAPLIILQ